MLLSWRACQADHRLYQMLGSSGSDHNDPALDMIGMAPISGDCDTELLLEMESWGMSHDFVMRSFASFPYNHASVRSPVPPTTTTHTHTHTPRAAGAGVRGGRGEGGSHRVHLRERNHCGWSSRRCPHPRPTR